MVARHEGKAAGKGRPVTRHPLFPVIAALWGGALVFVVALATGPGPIAGLVSALHVDRLIPQAAPPFGQTARLLFAVVLGLAGAGAGLILARHLGTDDTARAARREAATVRRQDRRALREEADPQGDVGAFEPVMAPPAGPPPVLDVAGFAAAHATLPPIPDVPDGAEPYALTASDELRAAEDVIPHGDVATPAAPPPATGGAAARRIVSADLASLSELELMERLALALERWRAMGGDTPAVPPPAGLLRAAERGPAPAAVFPALAPPPADLSPAAPHPNAVAAPASPVGSPEPAPSNPQATEAALRDALASLRRMSGAA